MCIEADTWMFLGSLIRWLQNHNHLGQAFFGSPVENEYEHFWFAHGCVVVIAARLIFTRD